MKLTRLLNRSIQTNWLPNSVIYHSISLPPLSLQQLIMWLEYCLSLYCMRISSKNGQSFWGVIYTIGFLQQCDWWGPCKSEKIIKTKAYRQLINGEDWLDWVWVTRFLWSSQSSFTSLSTTTHRQLCYALHQLSSHVMHVRKAPMTHLWSWTQPSRAKPPTHCHHCSHKLK